MRTWAIALLVASALAAKPARAMGEGWYGWQTLAADAATFGVYALGAGQPLSSYRHDLFLFGSGVMFVVASPLLHVANGEPVNGAFSLGTRVVLPMGLGLAGVAAGSLLGGKCVSACGFDGTVVGGILGFTIGLGAAAIVDASVIAHHRRTIAVAPVQGPAGERGVQLVMRF